MTKRLWRVLTERPWVGPALRHLGNLVAGCVIFFVVCVMCYLIGGVVDPSVHATQQKIAIGFGFSVLSFVALLMLYGAGWACVFGIHHLRMKTFKVLMPEVSDWVTDAISEGDRREILLSLLVKDGMLPVMIGCHPMLDKYILSRLAEGRHS